MKRVAFFLVTIALILVAHPLFGQENSTLKATSVSLKFDKAQVSDILSQLAKSSGMTVKDRRTFDTDKTISFHVNNVSFWPALDTIADKAGAVVSPYGKLSLGDGTNHAPVDNRGLVRSVVKRVETNADLVSGLRKCRLQVEFAWEPRLQPFYAEVKRWEIIFAEDRFGKAIKQNLVGTGKHKTFGVSAVEVPLSCLGADRSSPAIRSLKGELSLITPKSMWNARFAKLIKGGKEITKSQDGVKVSLQQFLPLAKGAWKAIIHLDHPGSGGLLDSSEQYVWLVNNRVYLQNKNKRDLIIEPKSVEDDNVGNGYKKMIVFVNPALTDPADWELVYRTAGPIVEVQVPFAFENLPLP